MAHVAGPVVAGHLGLRTARGLGEELGHAQDRHRRARADVVRRPRLGRSLGDRVDREQVGARDVVDVHEVAHLAAVLEDPRRLARLERGAEDRCDAGVRGVARHARAVDVVVPQPDGARPGLPGPRQRVVLLGQLARRIAAARVQPRVLRHELPGRASDRSARSGSRSRRRRARRGCVPAAAARRAARRRSGPRRRPPSSWPAPARPRRVRAWRRAARRCRGRCARRTTGGRRP